MSPLALAARDRASENEFADALLDGLCAKPKRIAAKYFYDARGSELFEAITALPEYYPTRTELAILTDNAAQLADCLGADCELVEFGAGSLRKVRILLGALERPRAYLPIDISGDFLMDMIAPLKDDFPDVRMRAVVGDFTRAIALGNLTQGAARRVGFFPGSTIGNFKRSDAVAFLRQARQTLNGGGILVGVDLVKNPAVLHAAYNDAAGVTAAFNKNLLLRANREADCDFDLEAFDHHACYNPLAQRVEMYLVSRREQHVQVAGETAFFAQGEAIHTEDSHKYTLDGFRALAAEAGYAPKHVWTDPAALFSVQWLEAI